MEIISVLTGLLIGLAIAGFLFSIWVRNRYVSKKDHDALSARHNEANTSLKVVEDRLTNTRQEHERLIAKSESREPIFTSMQARCASLETTAKNDERRINELAAVITERNIQQELLQKENNLLKQTLAETNAAQKSTFADLSAQKEINEKLETRRQELETKLNVFIAENSALAAQNASMTEKLIHQKEEIVSMQKTAQLEFEKIASRILEEKSGRFTEANRVNIEALLKPLGENIDLFKKRVEETYDKESKQRFSLEEKVRELMEQTNKVSAEANNLATALKGQAKKQGNWGEMILESILQKSGLVKDREYFLQKTITDEDGRNLRPDVLVNLPDNRVVIIDSKVSLVAYDRFSSSENADDQAFQLADHLKSIYGHINDLQGKKYDNLETSLDFTMMFIPIEPAYLIAIQADPELWSFAYSKRILLISPTNLIACLKLIADLWKREMQSKNAMEIVKRGELLYEKFVSFSESMEDVGRHLHKTQGAYDNAINQLKTGTGNLAGQALKLKNLGLKSSRQIPPAMLPADFEPQGDEGIAT